MINKIILHLRMSGRIGAYARLRKQGLSNEEARKHEEKITEIIHGAMKRYGLEEQMVLSALSWYNIFQANDPER